MSVQQFQRLEEMEIGRGNVRIGLALALVGGDVIQAAEDLEGGVALHAEGLAEIGLLCAVNLGELDVLLLQCSGSLLVLGGKGLAVAAPRGEDCRGDVLECGDHQWY